MADVAASVASIAASLSFIASLPFAVRGPSSIAHAAIASQDDFEGAILRDAEDGEAAYFQVDSSNNDDGNNDNAPFPQEAASKNGLATVVIDPAAHNNLRRSILGRSIAPNDRNQRWNIPKKAGPARVPAASMPTPLRRRPRDVNNAQHSTNDVEDPEAYLIAANKMLQMYPMQQASEHVQLLYSQYEGLMESIADLEEALQEPLPKRNAPSGSSPPPQGPSANEMEQLEADIRREELEILALKEMKAERDKQSRELDTQLRSKRNPATAQTRMPAKPPSTTSFSKPVIPKPPSTATTGAPQKSIFDRNSEARQAAKRLPAVVAKKMATDASAPASSPPRPPASRQMLSNSPRSASSPGPAVASPPRIRQTTSLSQTSSIDSDITPKKAAKQSSPVAKADQPETAVPEEQLKHALAKIATCLPQTAEMADHTNDAVLATLRSLSQPSAAPGSPESTVSSLAPSAHATSSEPAIKLEYHLLYLYLDLLLGHPSSSLELIFRDSAISGPAGPQDAMLSMNALKSVLGDFAKSNGWEGDLGTKAIYGLVAKRVLKIDRRGREALVCFTL